MSNDDFLKEIYLGCECMDLDHIAHCVYFLPDESKKEEEEEEEDNVIYFGVKAKNYLTRIIPPIRYFYDIDEWKSFFRFHFFRIIWNAIRYIHYPCYINKNGILDCFDFQNKDLPILDNFLSQLLENSYNCQISTEYQMDNEDFQIRFTIDRWGDDGPYHLQWEFQFPPRNLYGRIKHAFRYIFNRYCDQQEFEINDIGAAQIRGMINVIEEVNKQNEEKTK